MKKSLFLFAILFLCGVNSVKASVGDIFIVKNSDSKTCLKMLNENLKNASLENNILYSSQDKFYYHIYQDGVNVNIFVVDEGQNKNVVKELKLNIYPLEDNVLKKIESLDFVGLSEVAKKAIILQGVDFIPIYGIVAGVKTDIEKNLFTRPFPNNYSIGQNEQLRILALSKLMVEPIVDFTFEVDGRKKIIKICTYK